MSARTTQAGLAAGAAAAASGIGSRTVADRQSAGKAARTVAARASHARWQASPGRSDPVSILKAQDGARLPDLLPIRYGRMATSPFAFYRGAAAVMAADLAHTPACGITTQLCGDAHLSNFGVYASPERTLLFDLNDFDETHPGPFEWDVKRLAASLVVAARGNGFDSQVSLDAARAAVRSYREHMTAYAAMRDLDVWYTRVSAEDALDIARHTLGVRKKATERNVDKARTRDSLQAQDKLTAVVDGRRRIVDDPPLITHVAAASDALDRELRAVFEAYRRSLEDDRRALANRYTFVDFARKVVGVGSVGTRCFVALFEGRDGDDPLFLQVKEAGPSVLEPFTQRSSYANHGHRVVAGQRLMQAASDIFLGWVRDAQGRHYYWRQLRDMKGSLAAEEIRRPAGLIVYAAVCGWALARAHARGGDRIAIASYLGATSRFDRAVARFAELYADQTERDHETLVKAIAAGKVAAESGV